MKTELGLRIKAPEVGADDVERLCRALAGCGWQTAANLTAADACAVTDRDLRAIAEASDGRIISGQRGYALASECSADEIDHAASWLESQAKKMLKRAAAIRRRARNGKHNT